MRSRVLALVALVALAGCGSGTAPPQVTFAAGASSVVARPTQFCDLQLQNCQSDANAPVRLRVPAGTAVKVTVPTEISSAPWQVVFTYRSVNGSQTDGRSPVLAPDQHPDYTLALPAATDANAPVRLRVPAGTAVKVTVPTEISSAPWQVVFTYRSRSGSQTDGRSPVLAPDQHPDYTLALPAATDALVTAQVQQYGPPPQQNAETGEIEFPIRASWILNATS